MLTAVLPATNHKPDWVEIHIDGHYVARIWAHDAEVNLKPDFGQMQVLIKGELGITDAFVWADAVQKRDH